MNRPTLFSLIAVNTLLAIVLAGEWYAEQETPEILQVQTKTAETASEELPSLNLDETSEESYSDLVERPLFIKGRKPVAEPEPETVPVAAVKKIEAFNWELTGIFATPKGVMTFFSRTGTKVPKDNYRKHKLGDEIDGWKVSAIQPDNVTLTQAGETKVLPLRKIKPKNPVPVPVQANNRIPPQPPQKQPVPEPVQQLQTRDAVPSEAETPAEESREETAQE